MHEKSAILCAEGFEEVEALTVVDLLRRIGVACDIISLAGTETIRGSHGIVVKADKSFDETDFTIYDGLILPGGYPGTGRLAKDRRVLMLLRWFYGAGKLTAAICAAPGVLAKAGLLKGKRATCYPELEDTITGAIPVREAVVRDGTIITARGAGAAMPFALAIAEYLAGPERAGALEQLIVYP